MRLALVTAFPVDPARPRGGVEAVSVTLADALARCPDLEVHVVTTTGAGPAPARAPWRGATIHRLPRAGRWTLTGAIGAGRRMMRAYLAALAPDVVHAHDTYGLMVVGLPIPRVFTIHGFIHADTAVAGGRFARLRSALWRAVETRGWADQPHIIAISPYVRERLVAGRGPVIHDIENPIAREFFAVERADAGNVVFTAGAIGRRKNALALVDALARLRDRGIDARLRIAGHVAEPAYAARLEEAIRARRLADRVDLVGPLDTPGILGELRSASVFALASLEENSPLGIQEAMAAGVPVVTSNRCGMPYLVRDGESGYLIDPTRGEEIADRLARLLQDPRLRQRQGAHAAAAARDRFHPDDVARRTREVYRRAARAS